MFNELAGKKNVVNTTNTTQLAEAKNLRQLLDLGIQATQGEAAYVAVTTDPAQYCGNCVFYEAEHCEIVEGVIAPGGWCKYWCGNCEDAEAGFIYSDLLDISYKRISNAGPDISYGTFVDSSVHNDDTDTELSNPLKDDMLADGKQYTKLQAGYTDNSLNQVVRCGTCNFYQENRCVLVQGEINPDGACRYYEPQNFDPAHWQSSNYYGYSDYVPDPDFGTPEYEQRWWEAFLAEEEQYE
jgi:hypothetical protein